ncbi:molybdopterin guanine dinucleotide synthesis [Palleronia sp. LCG004]|uniref:molybdopterin guanine dinucleotide synthesis n=1 Tax=Palleronia sp. LCG004 TaxID=3079304 RepID=UPI00294373F6|nr:molybdopterin guanine dinucleotide synthesis [Palleronia sp. LCG004]WOI55413.1 molybdopterin guanine dinucleotide synthesis [Palleronia sp. LCG004]
MTFGTVVMIDWSGAHDRGLSPKPDAIWASVIGPAGELPSVYLRNPGVAEAWLLDLIARERRAGRRSLVGFDFPFGYPEGLAWRITGRNDVRALWDWFADAFDELPPGEGRFDIAGRLNRLLPGDGPFWFNGLPTRDIADLPRRKPLRDPGLPARRAVEDLAKGSFDCWQMGGTGAVGSQAMTGMATLARLRRALGADLAIWPFDPLEAPVAFVEIWPSLARETVARRLLDPDLPRTSKGPVKDAAQVSALARIVFAACRTGQLESLLDAAPPAARREEGWILGIGADLTLDGIAAREGI